MFAAMSSERSRGHLCVEISFGHYSVVIKWEADEEIPSVRIDFGRDGIHLIKQKSIQFQALRNYGTIERTQLPIRSCQYLHKVTCAGKLTGKTPMQRRKWKE
ncbi:hypothetical protein Btru_075326 [Bulinus truncatus]|nr:hypothetical protein Btru_075326 [Bulinus truncatus]